MKTLYNRAFSSVSPLKEPVPGTEASFDNLMGFYEVADTDGGIDTDGDEIADLNPGDAGYARSAITNRVENFEIRAGSDGNLEQNTTVDEFGNVVLAGGKLYAPFVIANGGSLGFDGFVEAEDGETDGVFNDAADVIDDQVAYFSFIEANPDGVEHLQALGNNTFGFEDLPSNLGVSDNDFNDAVFSFNASEPPPTEPPPTEPPPTTVALPVEAYATGDGLNVAQSFDIVSGNFLPESTITIELPASDSPIQLAGGDVNDLFALDSNIALDTQGTRHWFLKG